MISFEKSEAVIQSQNVMQQVAENMMRPIARHYDEEEGEIPWDFINFIHSVSRSSGRGGLLPSEKSNNGDQNRNQTFQLIAHTIEMLSWGDCVLYLCTPRGGLGATAVETSGTPDQRKKFLSKLNGEKPVFTSMAITEAGAGSDNSAIAARAELDEDTQEWVLNGEKIFITGGHKSFIDTDGFIVVWATLDPEAGRAGIRSFVLEAGTKGAKITKKEKKLGIRASDTVTLTLDDCRIPYENILGSPVIERSAKGFKSAMQTFNVTRPLVAASALGIARAALEMVKEMLAARGIEIRYGLPRQKMTNIEREIMDMERMWRSSWLLTLKAVWMSDNKQSNILESAMCKLHAGEVVTKITQKAVEIMGPLGYSREILLEKWMRDAKINDIFEGTGQINRLVAARQLLGYSGKDLR